MLTWETVKVVAEQDGYSFVITRGDEPDDWGVWGVEITLDDWGVEITTPDGGVDSEVCSTIEEAKQFCERTAAEVRSEG